jgi:hypothetical protein
MKDEIYAEPWMDDECQVPIKLVGYPPCVAPSTVAGGPPTPRSDDDTVRVFAEVVSGLVEQMRDLREALRAERSKTDELFAECLGLLTTKLAAEDQLFFEKRRQEELAEELQGVAGSSRSFDR